MKDKGIEPGLLNIFRLFIGLETVAYLFLASFSGPLLNAFLSKDTNPTRDQVNLAISFLLLLYLSIPWLERKLKRFYLPLALIAATILPMINSSVYFVTSLEEVSLNIIFSAFQLIPLLFVPLVLIAWQYSLREVLIFSLFTGIYDVSSAWIIAERLDLSVLQVMGVDFLRTSSFIIVGYIICELMRTQREQRRHLMDANIQLAQHALTLEQLGVSRERNRLARELHDTLAHTLSGLAVQLEAIKTVLSPTQTEASEMLDVSLATTRSGLSETRRALRDLRAAPLTNLGLSLALRTLAKSTAERANLELDARIPEETIELLPHIEQGIYRIAQETFENIIRHANARRVSVSLAQIDNCLELKICDDGKGFSPDHIDHEEHFGLKGMKERASMIGADLSVTSSQEDGTTVQLTLKGYSHD